MDEKLKQVLHKVELLCDQNPEFSKALARKLEQEISQSTPSSNAQLDEIYEYCIERVVRKQAQEYYAAFPIESIRQQLIDDFCRMERFRRADNFGDFCLAAYQQIECICRSLANNTDLENITKKLWAHSAYVYTGERKDNEYLPVEDISIGVRYKGNYRVADLIFPGLDKNDNTPWANKKYEVPLASQLAGDLMRIIIYFVCYQGMLKNTEYEHYKTFCDISNQLYQCRNLNHRGSEPKDWQKEIVNNILAKRSMYYFIFLGELVHFVDTVSKGIVALPKLAAKVQELPDKELQIRILGPTIKGKIELVDDGKKRFRRNGEKHF